MASIKIVGDITQQNLISRLDDKDIGLLNSYNLQENFGLANDYIEYHIIDNAGNLLSSDYNYLNYKLATNSVINPTNNGLPNIEIDPISDIQLIGYNSGQYTTQYNFFRNRLSSTAAELYISQISTDRTELRLASDILSNQTIDTAINQLIEQITDLNYYPDFLLNLGSNQQLLFVNIALDQTATNSTILVKLYEPLPNNINLKTNLWIVEEIIDPYNFSLNLTKLVVPDPVPTLAGPNFNIEIHNKNSKTTQYENYNNLITEISQSQNQVLNYLNQQSIQINTDYTDYSQFIHFGSANIRVSNFYNKVKQIEDYNTFIVINSPTTGSKPSLINDIAIANSELQSLITNFDGFETYLYFESSSFTWPKVSNNKPYILQSTGSAQVITWYNNTLASASLYDDDNLDNLKNTIPNFIIDDDNNKNYVTFLNLIGHYFDNIWIYLKAITKVYENKNNSNEGISKDIVQYMLQSLGMKLYNNGSDNLASYIVGANSGSIEQNNISDRDLLEETYRRLYHNLPYLNQSKGTLPGLRALITCFGIPSDILDINEYGGNSQTSSLEISEINNNKIRIINNSITGSVLTNLLKIETTPDDQLVNDLPYLDVSFNPNKPLNNKVKTAISSSFNIDNYIGDPTLENSSSYSTLQAIQKTQYGNYLNKFNYSQYIELVSYFDNSLFKMIQDFVPGRDNVSTGILIESPLLERNKIPRYNPNIDNQDILEAEYEGPTIVEDNSYLYNNLEGNKSAFYTGEITGSYYNIHKQFEKANVNPYLNHTCSFTQKTFRHSEFNSLLNNVSKSLKSKIRTELEPVFSNGIIIGEISSSFAELQDSYLSLNSYLLSRYLGSKVSSLTYNTYTTASDNYSGDISYGKTAAIDYTVSKIGLISQITESQFIPNANNITIKYLVDINGNLTELNQRNKHWVEVQNTFKASDNAVISLFDNQKYSNQRSTDGDKQIFNSGYTYYPIIYFSNQDSTMSFDFVANNLTNQFRAVTTNEGVIGPGSYYGISPSREIVNIWSNTDPSVGGYNDGGNYTPGVGGGSPHSGFYTIPQDGNYSFQSNLKMNATTRTTHKHLTLTLTIHSSDGQLGGSGYQSSTTIYSEVNPFDPKPYNNNFNVSVNVPSKTYASGTIIDFIATLSSAEGYIVPGWDLTPTSGFAESSLLGSSPLAYSDFIININNNTIFLNPEFKQLVNNVEFAPSGSSFFANSQSKLYTKFGDIDYIFTIDVGDIIVIVTTGGNVYEFDVIGYDNSDTGSLQILSSNIPGDLIPSDVSSFILLKPIKDETNVILDFNKKPGLTSLGLLIPSNLDQSVLANIDVITSNVKSKLIDLGL